MASGARRPQTDGSAAGQNADVPRRKVEVNDSIKRFCDAADESTDDLTLPGVKSLLVAEDDATPDEFVRFLKQNGLQRLNTLRTTDPKVLAKFKGQPFMTVGCDRADVDCIELWQGVLGLNTLVEPGQMEDENPPPVDEEQPSESRPLLANTSNVGSSSAKQRDPKKLWGVVRGATQGGFIHESRDAWAHHVQLEAYVVTVKNAAACGTAGVLHPLLRRYQADMCSVAVFGLPSVQAVVCYKWDHFAMKLTIFELVVYCVWMFAFFGFMGCFEAKSIAETLPELLSTSRGVFCLIFEVVAFLGMMPFLIQDIVGAYVYRQDWLCAWNILDGSTYTLQIAITALHLGHLALGQGGSEGALATSHTLPLLMGVQCILLFTRLQYFSRCFRGMAFDFLNSLQAVFQDTWWYICVMLLLVLGFAGAFWITFRDTEQERFNTLPLAALTMLNWAVGGAASYFEEVITSDHPDIAIGLCVVYQFVVSMIMMSMLTGILISALTKSSETEYLKFHMSRARIIDELESIMPNFVMKRLKLPKYVHVLRVDPDSITKIESQYLWNSTTNDKEGPADSPDGSGPAQTTVDYSGWGSPDANNDDSGAAPPPPAAVAALQSRLDSMAGEVQDVKRMLTQLLEATKKA